METGVHVGAAVLDDSEAEVVVDGFEQSREHDTAGGNAEEDKRVNVVGAEDHPEVGSGESTDAMLGDDDFAFLWGDYRRDCSKGSLKQFLMQD
jgi:hypothetical protein